VSRGTLLILQALVAIVSIAAWHVLTTERTFGVALLPPFFFSTPGDVAEKVVKLFATGMIWNHLWITLAESMLAFVIGSLAGVLVGFWSKVALGVTLVFFIVFFNVYQGVKEVSPTVLANARMLGMNEKQLMRHVYWPSALSWMFSSLHTSVGFAVVGAVVGEYLGAAAGLGYLIQQAEGVFDVAGVFAGMFILAVFVVIIDWIVTLVERRLLVWRPVASETRTA
jgi:NitT/TauT family transport system permease protein